jgi:hypothetical protein
MVSSRTEGRFVTLGKQDFPPQQFSVRNPASSFTAAKLAA